MIFVFVNKDVLERKGFCSCYLVTVPKGNRPKNCLQITELHEPERFASCDWK
jgi:predicted nucleic acid-binding Zn finger protein